MSAIEEVVSEAPAVEAVPKRAMTLGYGTSLVVLALFLIVPLFVKNFIIFQLTMLLIYALAVLALNILTGGSGQFSLGQSAFYAIGAYTAAILIEHGGVNYVLTLPIAGIVCFGVGFLFGFPALRLSGIYLALATYAFAVAMPQLLKLGVFEHWTGGVQGLVVTKPDAPFGLPISQDMWLYYFTLAVSIAIYVASVNLLRSRSGRATAGFPTRPSPAPGRFSTAAARSGAFRRRPTASGSSSPSSPSRAARARSSNCSSTAVARPARGRPTSSIITCFAAGRRGRNAGRSSPGRTT